MDFKNTYEDDAYAAAYARLEFPGTYYLAFRDLPELISRHISGEGGLGGRKALDIGCGTGRSTRFLSSLGLDAVGADISQEMIKRAYELDPKGDYRLVRDADLSGFPDESFDLVLSAFTFDNIPTRAGKWRSSARWREFSSPPDALSTSFPRPRYTFTNGRLSPRRTFLKTPAPSPVTKYA